MKLPAGARVVLLQDVRAAGAVLPIGTPGIVKRSTGEVVIVAFEDGRTLPVKIEKLGIRRGMP